MKGLSHRERDEGKHDERRVNLCLGCSILAKFVFLKISIGLLERKIVFLILFFKYYADVENCRSFRGFSYIYIYIYIYRNIVLTWKILGILEVLVIYIYIHIHF